MGGESMGGWQMAFLMGLHYNLIKKMHSFIQNLCVPSEPKLRPLAHAELIDQFSLQSNMLALTEEEPAMWQLEEQPEEESQEETMEVEQDRFSAKRRHCTLVEAFSKRPMFSKLQRMDRAPVKRRHF